MCFRFVFIQHTVLRPRCNAYSGYSNFLFVCRIINFTCILTSRVKLELFFSQGEENGLRDVAAQIHHVVQAARGLKDVSDTIRNLCGFGLACSTLASGRCLSEAEVTTLKEGFCCLVCRGQYFEDMCSDKHGTWSSKALNSALL